MFQLSPLFSVSLAPSTSIDATRSSFALSWKEQIENQLNICLQTQLSLNQSEILECWSLCFILSFCSHPQSQKHYRQKKVFIPPFLPSIMLFRGWIWIILMFLFNFASNLPFDLNMPVDLHEARFGQRWTSFPLNSFFFGKRNLWQKLRMSFHREQSNRKCFDESPLEAFLDLKSCNIQRV